MFTISFSDVDIVKPTTKCIVQETNYQPISCNYYDILESLATFGKKSTIVYYDEKNKESTVTSKIVNLFTKSKEEFLELESGALIRLDKLIKVNEIVLEGFHC